MAGTDGGASRRSFLIIPSNTFGIFLGQWHEQSDVIMRAVMINESIVLIMN